MPSFNTPDPITARIDVVSGDVRVVAGERDTTTVAVAPADPSNPEDVKAAELTRVELAGGELLVKAPKLRSWLPRSTGGALIVTVEFPSSSRLRATTPFAANSSASLPTLRCRSVSRV